ncbi:MAG: HAMP domain-containing histidine kinase [Pyrinomonadaceae bacterium]|nr:HAMP domain-containing histidine kinase [Phycisphaerales bacterium]
MTLQQKFVLLITMLAVAIAGSGFAAFWSFRFLRNELGVPFQSSVKVLSRLGTFKRNVEEQARIIADLVGHSEPSAGPSRKKSTDAAALRRMFIVGADGIAPIRSPWRHVVYRSATPVERVAFRGFAVSSLERIESLEADTWYLARVGGSTWRNIKARLNEATTVAIFQLSQEWRIDAREHALRHYRWTGRPGWRQWQWIHPEMDSARGGRAQPYRSPISPSLAQFLGRSPSDPGEVRTQILNGYFEIHELIEKTEQRILTDASDAVLHGDSVQQSLLWWLMSVLLMGALGSVLAFILLRRWVDRPVAALREAALHISQGDLTYRINAHGSDELARLSREVNHMAEMVHVMQEERIDRERLAAIGGMVRRLVHNVRNPLSGIRGLAELTRMDTPAGSENRDNLDLIVSTVDTFERWLNELLATTTPTNLQMRPTKVGPWMQSIVEVHRPMAQTKGVELIMDVTDAPDVAEFDPMHLDHALAALVSNAIEATPEKGKVWVRAQSSAEAGKWEIWILDQGKGIPREFTGRIFDPHFTTKRQGTGMGLAMSQQVIRTHGGRISLESAPHSVSERVGAVFVIRLPLIATTNDQKVLVENSQ